MTPTSVCPKKFPSLGGITFLTAVMLISGCKEKSSTAADSKVEEALSSKDTTRGDPAKRPGHIMSEETPTPTPQSQ
jgi:hypothetical protein